MPILFYGTTRFTNIRQLHNALLDPVRGSVFDHFKVDHLAPYWPCKRPQNWWAVANHWHFVDRDHTALSWHHPDERHEQTIFMPGLHSFAAMITLCRIEYYQVLPSPVLLRVNNEESAYVYRG